MWPDVTRATEVQDRILVAADIAGTGTPGITVINWSQVERDKFRVIAASAWKDMSTKSALAKEAYDAHIKFMKILGLL